MIGPETSTPPDVAQKVIDRFRRYSNEDNEDAQHFLESLQQAKSEPEITAAEMLVAFHTQGKHEAASVVEALEKPESGPWMNAAWTLTKDAINVYEFGLGNELFQDQAFQHARESMEAANFLLKNRTPDQLNQYKNFVTSSITPA